LRIAGVPVAWTSVGATKASNENRAHWTRRSIMAPRTRKEADLASSSNPPNMDALDASMAESDADTMEDPAVSLEEDTKGEIGAELRHRMISEAAYQLYAERGYVDGLELDDWLQAEAEVDRRLGGQRATH